MIKVEEIIEKYKGYEVDEEKLKEFLTPPKPKTVYELKKVDKYYYIDTFGTACSDIWDNDEIDNGRREIGNCFLTKEDAEFEVERRKIEAILLKYGKKVKSSQNEEYFILYDFVDKKVAIYPSGGVCYQGTIYFTSYALAQRAIKEAGEDNIKNYIFRVDVECVKKGYGKEPQCRQAMEECAELIQAVNKMLRYEDRPAEPEYYANLVEEIADVEIMLYQLKVMFNVSDDEVFKVKIQKAKREKERLENHGRKQTKI